MRVFGLIALEFAVFNIGFCWWVFGGDILVDADVWRSTEAIFALLDYVVCELENFGARAIVFTEQNMLWTILGVEFEEVRAISALEAVNCLIVITYGHNIWAAFVAWVVSELRDELTLCVISILIFIEQNVLETFLRVVAFFGVILEKLDGGKNHIVVVVEAFFGENLRIFAHDKGEVGEFIISD